MDVIGTWAPEYQFNIAYDRNTRRYRAHAPELKGTESEGGCVEEAHENLRAWIRNWLAMCEENGLEMAPPKSRKVFSGKFVLRVTAEMHAQLSWEAGLAGTSLNSLILDALTLYLRKRNAVQRPTWHR